jgi:hypothetical protein
MYNLLQFTRLFKFYVQFHAQFSLYIQFRYNDCIKNCISTYKSHCMCVVGLKRIQYYIQLYNITYNLFYQQKLYTKLYVIFIRVKIPNISHNYKQKSQISNDEEKCTLFITCKDIINH